MVLRQTRICTLTTRVEGIYHISGLSEFALGCLKVVMASAVAMEKDHRLAFTFGCIEQADAVDMGGRSVAFIFIYGIGRAARRRRKGNGKGQKGTQAREYVFHRILFKLSTNIIIKNFRRWVVFLNIMSIFAPALGLLASDP